MPPQDPQRNPNPLSITAIQSLAEATATETGKDFFLELTRRLSELIGTKGAWVTEWIPETKRLSALGFWFDGEPFGDYEYEITGTPCEPVLETKDLVHVPERLIELFPDDPDLPAMNAVSYMGVPLFDTDGEVLGHLAVLHDKPMPENQEAAAVFRVFAGRASGELRRLRRDRDLQEREQRLRRLIDSAMDGIIELDGELRVRGMNPAAGKIFRQEQGPALEAPLEEFFDAASCQRIRDLDAELEKLEPGERSAWIAEGLQAKRGDGSTFPAEATLSAFELSGCFYYTLILRNIDDRLAAEARIQALTSETEELRRELDALSGFDEIIGESPALRATLLDVDKVAGSDASVLISGETGTGKELIARAIHQRSQRKDQPLVKVNCAAIPANLQESEFFGHVKGAFTGASEKRMGRFELADGGTIFLDEVGEMPRDLQAKLLRVLQEGEFESLGSTSTRKVNVRVLAATNRDLEAMVAADEFRADLLYRLNVFPLHVPALRDRGEDVILLAEMFLRAQTHGRGLELSADDRVRLLAYDWPGNVRELQNVIERAWLTSSDGKRLNMARALSAGSGAKTRSTVTGGETPILTADEVREFERSNLIRALEASKWRVSGADGAAEKLGMNANTLSSRMRALGIERPR